MVYDEHLLAFWESGIGDMPTRGYLCDQLPVKTLGTESQMGRGKQHFTSVVPIHCGGIKHIPCDCTGRDLSEACA